MEAHYIIVHEHSVDYWIEKGEHQAKCVKMESSASRTLMENQAEPMLMTFFPIA